MKVHHGAESELERYSSEQKRYRDLVEALDIALFEWSKTGELYCTENFQRYELSTQSMDKILTNKADLSVIHPDDVPNLQGFFANFHKKQIRNSIVLRLKMRDGSFRWTEMLCFNEFDQNQKISKIMGVFRDVDRERIEQNERLSKALDEARRANQAKTDFLSRVSHDMRTPLNGVLGLTALLKERITDTQAQRDLSELEMSGNYLLELINDTLDMSRIESGKLELHPIVYDGRTMFNNALGLGKSSLQGKDIQVNVHADNIPFTLLYVDVSRFEQVVMNVFGNAVKFTPDGGTIDMTLTNLSVENGIITDQLIIKDNGIGMSPDFLPHIFDVFVQENPSKTGATQGTGLGMAITKQILELMGGSICIESELGKGTCCTMILKFQVATPQQIAEWKKSHNKIVVGSELQDKRVLLCEDHPLNAQIATRLLEGKGARVEHAENGQVAVDMFHRSSMEYYDVILMDIRMPVMDGIEAARTIRELSRKDAQYIPIIAMTANAFADDEKETKSAGMDAHLSKPIQPEKLFRTMEELLHVDHDLKKQKILVVDDIEVNREVIRVSLENDYEILEAENGKEAMEMLEHTRGISAVITDIQMPEMDGIELIRKIRSNSIYRRLVIIANTQFGDPEQEEHLLALGANDFVYKPTTPKIVEIRVRNALNRL